MYFGEVTCAIRKSHFDEPFELSPASATVQFAEARPNLDRSTQGDRFDLTNVTDDREPHRSMNRPGEHAAENRWIDAANGVAEYSVVGSEFSAGIGGLELGAVVEDAE